MTTYASRENRARRGAKIEATKDTTAMMALKP